MYDGYGRYDYNRPDPRYGGYYADRYYRDDPRYRERRLSRNDRVYRGRDGRYYCRRSDGTTGLIVGGLAGGVLGNVIAPGGSETLGTIIGRSEEHTSELQSLMRISYAVFCLKKKKIISKPQNTETRYKDENGHTRHTKE